MVDIHSHALPGIDDVAPDYETALEMCRMAARSGTRELVATPHSDVPYKYNLATAQRLIEKLQAYQYCFSQGTPRAHSLSTSAAYAPP